MIKTRYLENFSIIVLFTFFCVLLFLLVVKLFSIQVLGHEKYSSLAEKQYRSFLEISAKRGDIVSSDNVILAGTQTNYLLFVEPNRVHDKYRLAFDLAKKASDLGIYDKLTVNPTDESSQSSESLFSFYNSRFIELLTRDLVWVGLLRNLNPSQKEEFEKAGFEGVGFEEEPVRYYPEGRLASHVLGFVAFNDLGEKQGYFGIEGYFNEDLKGKPGKIIQYIDAAGTPILAGGYKRINPIEGRTIVLTLDRSVQYMVEKKLEEGVRKYNAVSGSVIVMNPSSGEVLAMANFPSYQPDDFSTTEEVDETSQRKNVEKRNLSISQTYEPGSVLKPLTISAAIDLGTISPQTTFEDNGPVWYSGHVIDNWDGKHHGVQNIIQLLQKSNNIGAVWVGHKIGAKNLHKYLEGFGIGTTTGIELEGEDTGILRPYKDWTDIDLATISFGQGISTTSLQVLNSFNAIANGGILPEPRIVSEIIDSSKKLKIPAHEIRRVISEKTANTMVSMLEEAASGGEAKFYVLKNYKIAGKTGTAQIPKEGKYDPSKTNATFAGFMSGSKKFSMIVKLEEPKTSPFAAETAVPLWMDIASDLVNYYGLTPDKNVE